MRNSFFFLRLLQPFHKGLQRLHKVLPAILLKTVNPIRKNRVNSVLNIHKTRISNIRASRNKCLPALEVCSFLEPVKNGIFCQNILVIQRPHNLREQLHQFSILVALDLDFVHEFQFKLSSGAESIQQFCPFFHLHKKEKEEENQ